MDRFILSLDQGTTSSRAIIFNHDGRVVASAQQEFEQILPAPGLVEHDPEGPEAVAALDLCEQNRSGFTF